MIRNGIYNVVSAAIRTFLAVLAVPVLIHALGIEEFGVWTLIASTIGVVGLADIGLGVASTVFVARDIANGDNRGLSETLTVIICAISLLALLAAALLWALAPGIIGIFPDVDIDLQPVAVSGLRLGALVIGARLVQQILIGLQQAFQQYQQANVLSTVQSVATNIGYFAVVSLGGRTVSLMQWLLVVTGCTLIVQIVAVWFLIRNSAPKPAWNWQKSVEISKYTFNAWLTTLGSTLFSQGDRLIVGGVLGVASLGLYGAITSIAGQLNVFSSLVIQPILPIVTKLHTKVEAVGDEILEQVRRAVVANAGVALGLGIICLASSTSILQLVMSSANPRHVLFLQITLVIYSLYSLNAPGFFVLYGLGKAHKNTVTVLVGGTLALGCMALLSRLLGEIGAFLGNIAYILTVFLNILMMHELKMNSIRWFLWLRYAIVWFLCSAMIIIFTPVNLLYMLLALPLVVWALLGLWPGMPLPGFLNRLSGG